VATLLDGGPRPGKGASREEERRRRRKRRRRLRAILWGLAGAVALAIVVPIGTWIHYRTAYIVSTNALVKGSIADVGAPLDGIVTEVAVDVGDRVREGQVLVRFEDRQLVAKVDQQRSQLEKAELELQVEPLAIAHEERRLKSRVAEATARLASAEAQLEAAQSRANDAQKIHERRIALAQEGVIGEAELADAEGAVRTAHALVSAAGAEREAAAAALESARVDFNGLSVRRERVVLLDSQRGASAASLALAEAELAGTVIRAPADGWVVRRIVEPGVSVVVGAPIMALWIGDDVWIEAWIDEDDLASVEVGSSARVTLKPYPDREFTGFVETIGVSTDFELPDAAVPQPRHERMRGTPLVGVRVRLENPEADLLPGLSAVVGIRKKRSGPRSLLAEPDRAQPPATATR
jgi:multidrug resistance efflux pump